MNRTKWAFGCAFAALLVGVYFTQATAQSPESGPAPAAKSQAKPATAEKPGLAEAAKQATTENRPVDFCQCVGQDDTTAVARIEQALAAPLHSNGLDFTDQPLKEVLNALQDEYGIPIQLDRPALEEAAIGIDSPLTINFHNISLRSALRLMLKQFNLTSIIQDEVLMITTKEAAEKSLKICVYDARKIMADTSDKKMESLSDTIMACIATDTWSENQGGAAEIRALPPGLLVVSQTQAVHQEIHDLLATIRNMSQSHSSDIRASSTPAAKVEPKPEPAPVPSSSEKPKRPEKAGGGGGGGGGFGGGGGGGENPFSH